MTTDTPRRQPTLRTGEALYCEDCRPGRSRKVDDLTAQPCPCGATFDGGARKGARYVETAR